MRRSARMRPGAAISAWVCASSLFLAACTSAGAGDQNAIVVIFSVDTIGQAMANRTDMCGEMTALTANYGLDVACLDGAIAPSSWTGESHARFLWPQDIEGARRALQYPKCGDESVLGTIKDGTRGKYFYGADNSVLSGSGKDICGITRTQFTQDTDQEFETSLTTDKLVDVPEEDRPAHHAIDAFVDAIGPSSGASVLFLNAVEPGGHEPRCWFDPYSQACSALWDVATNAGLADPDADRRSTWTDPDFYARFTRLFGVKREDREAEWRPLFWDAIDEAVVYFRAQMFEDRLRRVLDAIRDAGRLGDLRLVVLGDHGENPCVLRGLGDQTLNCGHNGLPTEYTAFVPVFVTPASLAGDWTDKGLIGDSATPWSTVNLAFGMVDSVGLTVPGDWGQMEPVGTATSWTCKGPDGTSPLSGIHVEGEAAMRCHQGACEASGFTLPTDETYEPAVLSTVPDGLQAFAGPPDWFSDACAGGS